jgi:hypothetical protein
MLAVLVLCTVGRADAQVRRFAAFGDVTDLDESNGVSSTLKSDGVAGGGARRFGGLASRLTRLLAAHVVLAACDTGDQNAPIAQVRAGPGPGGVTRAFKDPPKSRRGWQEVVRVAWAALRRD